MSEAVVLRLETALEELLTNTVVHGHSDQVPASEVWIGITAHGGGLSLCYEDALGAFNPEVKIDEALKRIVRQVAMEEIGKKPEVRIVISRLSAE